MKRYILLVVLLTVLTVGAFAKHPSGWGLGVGYQGFDRWKKGHDYGSGISAFIKAPVVPIYWGLDFQFTNGWYKFQLSGDYHFLDKTLVQSVNFGWFLGAGANFGLTTAPSSMIAFDLRLPTGFYIMPSNSFEIFLDVVPSIGLDWIPKFPIEYAHFPGGGLQFDIGVRFWF